MATNDWQVMENAAPVDTSGPLPYEVQTLKYIPEANRCQYVRDMTGGFRLGWVEEGPDVARFADLIAKGQLRMMKPGETPADVAAREEVRAQMDADMQAEIARLEAKQRDEFIAQANAKAEREAERIRLEADRLIRDYGKAAPGAPMARL